MERDPKLVTFSREISLATARAGLRVTEMAAEIARALKCGDTRTAHFLCIDLIELAAHLSDTQWKVADGDYGAARDAAAKL